MNSFNIANLKEDIYFTDDLVLDNSFILLDNSLPVTRFLLDELKKWEFSIVYSNGTIGAASAADLSQDDMEEINETDINAEKEATSSALQKALASAHAEKNGDNETSRLETVRNVYNEYMSYINTVYTHYATHTELDLQDLSDKVKELCIFIKENRRFVLRISPAYEIRQKNYLVCHSMRSTVLALTIGLQLRMPLSKLVELGVACILHEIGMIRLPPQLYINYKPLSPVERAQMATHTLLGYTILKDAQFPLSIQLATLEHHERENGTGYPRHLTGDKISLYAKIIAVACSFEAITAPRQYRDARSTYEAMIEMLKNESNQYDGTVIKALLHSLSLFPIGVYVYLKNGKVAQVIDVNPEAPRNPIVQLIGEKTEDGGSVVLQSDDNVNKIVRVLTKKESVDVLKAFKIKDKDVVS
jgi:HD-GYP domain-containing protein (c-di-GMP phosphodiesterase class II)